MSQENLSLLDAVFSKVQCWTSWSSLRLTSAPGINLKSFVIKRHRMSRCPFIPISTSRSTQLCGSQTRLTTAAFKIQPNFSTRVNTNTRAWNFACMLRDVIFTLLFALATREQSQYIWTLSSELGQQTLFSWCDIYTRHVNKSIYTLRATLAWSW
jgi:hypothetical protein